MFDRYVEAQEHPPGRRAKQLLLIASVVVHAMVLVGLIVWSFIHVEEVAPPLLTVTFFSGAAPPPPPPPPPPPKPKNVASEPNTGDYANRPDPHVPDAIKIQRKGTGEAVFIAKLCMGQDGHVLSVTVLSGIPGADDAILATMRQWR